MTATAPQRDDNLIDRFEGPGLQRWRARDAVLAILVMALLLGSTYGASVLSAGDERRPGVGRDALLAVGRPADWLSQHLPLHSASHSLTAWLAPEAHLGGGAFPTATAGAGSVPVVTPEAFPSASLGVRPAARRKLQTLLVTGDSMSMPLDDDLARKLDPKGVHVVEDPHIGTGLSSTLRVNWGKLAAAQVKANHPDAVVVFIGANEGFPMPGPAGRQVACCNAEWAAIYANRAREMANTYRQAGAARVYWITLPTPREAARREIATVVNAAIEVAAQPWSAQVIVINTVPVFTPHNVYRAAMDVGGTETIVREPDGVHLNDAGSSLLAAIVLERIAQDFVD